MNFSEMSRRFKIKPQAVHNAYVKGINKIRNYYETLKLSPFLDEPEKGERRLMYYRNWIKNNSDTTLVIPYDEEKETRYLR